MGSSVEAMGPGRRGLRASGSLGINRNVTIEKYNSSHILFIY